MSSPNLGGKLRTNPAAKAIYIGVPDVATLTRIATNGGRMATRFKVKGVVILGLFTDPAGNAMALVELNPDGKTRVP